MITTKYSCRNTRDMTRLPKDTSTGAVPTTLRAGPRARHSAPRPRMNSVVKATEAMYVSCDSDLGHAHTYVIVSGKASGSQSGRHARPRPQRSALWGLASHSRLTYWLDRTGPWRPYGTPGGP